jgi:hypothetical protein
LDGISRILLCEATYLKVVGAHRSSSLAGQRMAQQSHSRHVA